MEVKTSPIEACEFKFDDDAWKITGYASVFNSVDKVGDTILPGAFTKSIESGDEIKMYYELPLEQNKNSIQKLTNQKYKLFSTIQSKEEY